MDFDRFAAGLMRHALDSLEPFFERSAVQAAIMLAVWELLENTAQSIAREFPAGDLVTQRALSLGVRLSGRPFHRLVITDAGDQSEIGRALALIAQLIGAAVGTVHVAQYLADTETSVIHNCATRLAAAQYRGPELGLRGHNLYPFPSYRRGITYEQAVRFAPGAPIRMPILQAPLVARTSVRRSHAAGSRLELPIHPLALELAPHWASQCRPPSDGVFDVEGVALTSMRTTRLTSSQHGATGDFKCSIPFQTTSASRVIQDSYLQSVAVIGDLIEAILGEVQPSRWTVQVDRSASWATTKLDGFAPSVIRRAPSQSSSTSTAVCLSDFWYDADVIKAAVGACGGLSDFVDDYVACVVAPPLTLAFEYGVYLEPHLQNVTLLLNSDGIESSEFRDTDNIFYLGKTVERYGLLPRDLGPNLGGLILAGPRAGLCSLQHTLVHANVGEAIIQLSHLFELSPHDVREMFKQSVARHFDASNPSHRQAAQVLLSEAPGVKRLLTMHLGRATNLAFDPFMAHDAAQLLAG